MTTPMPTTTAPITQAVTLKSLLDKAKTGQMSAQGVNNLREDILAGKFDAMAQSEGLTQQLETFKNMNGKKTVETPKFLQNAADSIKEQTTDPALAEKAANLKVGMTTDITPPEEVKTSDEIKRQEALDAITPPVTGNKIADTALAATAGPIVPSWIKNTAENAWESLKQVGGALNDFRYQGEEVKSYTSDFLKSLVDGTFDPSTGKFPTSGKTEALKERNAGPAGKEFHNLFQGTLGTVFSPVSGLLESIPGGDKVASALSLPREAVGGLWEYAWKKAGKDTSDPNFQMGKQQIMDAFDAATLVLPETKAGKAAIDATVNAGKTVITAPFKAGSYLTKEGFTKMTGLAPETIKTIVENPEKFKTVKDLGVDTAKNNLFENVKTAIDDTITELSDTGAAYETVRANTKPAPVPEGYWTSLADELKIKPQVDSTGALMGFVSDSTSKIRSQAELAQLTNSLQPYWGKTELLPEEFLNYRSDLTNLAKFDTAKSSDLMGAAKDIRFKANEQIGANIEGLRPLDAKYSAQIQYANKVKELIYDKKGNVKDGALSTLANLTGKGKEFKLARLEEIMPEVAADIKAIKALENVNVSSQNPVGQYSRGAATALAFGKALTGDPAAFSLGVGLAITHPAIVSEFLRMIGEAKLKLSKAEIEGIATKIDEGTPLTTEEAASVSDLLNQITAADLVPFLATPSGEPIDQSAEE